MSAFFEGRRSDSPYIDMVWRGHVEQDYFPVCPADVRWNLLFMKHNGKVRVTAEGATTHYVPKYQFAGVEFLVIKFSLGTYMPHLPAVDIRDKDTLLPDSASQRFWLHSSSWQLPDFDNVETFVECLVRQGIIVQDPLVKIALQDKPVTVSSRTVRRRFIHTTGLTHGSIRQIERAHQAATLLQQGVPILDTVYEAGYADQPHLTRSLRRFYGQTPAQLRPAQAS
ncbi:MAG: AraC family transcriptional regulator [Anaerolineae bacterium]